MLEELFLGESEVNLLKAKDVSSIIPNIERLYRLDITTSKVYSHKGVRVECNFDVSNRDFLYNTILSLVPWRKGPFFINDIHINAEWQSFIKMNAVKSILSSIGVDVQGKRIADIGCNNGYYMFELALEEAGELIGFDPSAKFFLQFCLINCFTKLGSISFRLTGVENASEFATGFDITLCLGVLYHRRDQIETLRCLKSLMSRGGVLILETLILLDEREILLVPYPTYAGMSNVYYVSSPKAVQNLSRRAGFKECEFVHYSFTNNEEQRSTEFVASKSLGDLLLEGRTTEGYPAVCRGIFYLKA